MHDAPHTLPITQARATAVSPSGVVGFDRDAIRAEIAAAVREATDKLRDELRADVLDPLKAVIEIAAAQAQARAKPPREIIDIAEVEQLVGMSATTIDRRIEDAGFPPPLQSARGRKRHWRRSAVEAWLARK